jgi:hypothetical protein
VANHVPAEDNADQLARIAATLGGAQNDIARNIIGIVDEPLGQLAGIPFG